MYQMGRVDVVCRALHWLGTCNQDGPFLERDRRKLDTPRCSIIDFQTFILLFCRLQEVELNVQSFCGMHRFSVKFCDWRNQQLLVPTKWRLRDLPPRPRILKQSFLTAAAETAAAVTLTTGRRCTRYRRHQKA